MPWPESHADTGVLHNCRGPQPFLPSVVSREKHQRTHLHAHAWLVVHTQRVHAGLRGAEPRPVVHDVCRHTMMAALGPAVLVHPGAAPKPDRPSGTLGVPMSPSTHEMAAGGCRDDTRGTPWGRPTPPTSQPGVGFASGEEEQLRLPGFRSPG